MRVEVLAGGLLTTIQDLGREGCARWGVGRGGAADRHSAAIANLLVGNRPGAALLEITLSGPELVFRQPARIALCGADTEAHVDSRVIPGWRPVELPAGSRLRIGRCLRGSRAYLAVGGGFRVAGVLGSSATDLRGGFGGFLGRPIEAGDTLELHEPPIATPSNTHLSIASWWIDARPDIDFSASTVAGVLPGADTCTPGDVLTRQAWTVDADSNRQALRLRGPRISLEAGSERPSEPVLPGTIQCPPDGQPVVLLADAQTVGGYPRIGHVAAADLPRLAQLRPGQSLCFHAIDAAQAVAALDAQRARLARMRLAIESRIAG